MQYFYLIVAALAFVTYVNCDACVQCDSKTDPKCATNPERFLAKECSNSTSKCFSRVVGGTTIRGCASDLDNKTATACSNEMDCLICTFMEGCNRNVFPTHRSQCLQCVGNGTGFCASDTFARPRVCPIYEIGDKCFIRKSKNANLTNAFMRGCLSSAHAEKLCRKDDCYTCEGTGCNYIPADSADIPFANAAAILNYSLYLIFGIFLIRSKLL
ncbi:uncharacterized protein LOC129911204 [Episyrphus balteatus]|uniref:uncharacterized protein LOC129911204 n=1 Tax=Episyrphus balteatus TaxID=286459 RepID=UPI002485AEC0|nr:uncharacterized protein LOC129911204 [Episyrphus balteatus]